MAKELKKEISFRNRYNVEIKLILIDESKSLYKLYISNPKEYDYLRVGLLEGKTWEDKEYSFIDPSGGPFLCVGSEVEGMIISRITEDKSKHNQYYIIFENS